MKESLAIYPFTNSLLPMIHYQDEIKDYKIKYAVIPNGWEHFESLSSNSSCLCCSEEAFCDKDFIKAVDTILLCKPPFKVNISLYDKIIEVAKICNKRILYTEDLNALIPMSSSWTCLNSRESYVSKAQKIRNIDVPVVLITGLGEYCEKWEIQLGLQKYFQSIGYKASLISSNPISQLMGFHLLPIGVDSKNLTFMEQVYCMNSFVKNVELLEKPNVIIIGVAGGILKYNETISNHYGYLNFLISSAVVPDISIISLYCGDYEESHIKKIQSLCYYRFGIIVNYFHMSNNACTFNPETNQMEYCAVDTPYLISKINNNKSSVNLFNILDKDSKEKTFKAIVKELQNNISAM